MTTQHEVEAATSTELHALWGMLRGFADTGSRDCLEVLERWERYVIARRERFGKV